MNELPKIVHFRLKYTAKSFGPNINRLIRFPEEGPYFVSVEIGPLLDDELDSHAVRGDLSCIAEMHSEPTRRIAQWLEGPRRSVPKGFTEFAVEAYDRLSISVIRALKLLRWRVGFRGEPNPIKYLRSFEWSADGENWNPITPGIQLRMEAGFPTPKVTDEAIMKSVVDLWRGNISEPLSHELFQEAWGQHLENPRSAIVFGIAAAETGMKRLISELVPATEWIMKEIQSPPLTKMLEEYLPLLPTRVKVKSENLPPLPKDFLATIKKGVKLRNDIVHGQDVRLRPDSVREILGAINDVLYILDIYSGQLWAEQLLSIEMKIKWLNGAS